MGGDILSLSVIRIIVSYGGGNFILNGEGRLMEKCLHTYVLVHKGR